LFLNCSYICPWCIYGFLWYFTAETKPRYIMSMVFRVVTQCSSLFTLRPWKWRQDVPSKRRALSDLHGVTTRKTVLFIVIAVRVSNAADTGYSTYYENIFLMQYSQYLDNFFWGGGVRRHSCKLSQIPTENVFSVISHLVYIVHWPSFSLRFI
jgi:hypothetical protein